MIFNWFEKDELKWINYHTTEIADWLISDDHKMALVVADGATYYSLPHVGVPYHGCTYEATLNIIQARLRSPAESISGYFK